MHTCKQWRAQEYTKGNRSLKLSFFIVFVRFISLTRFFYLYNHKSYTYYVVGIKINEIYVKWYKL